MLTNQNLFKAKNVTLVFNGHIYMKCPEQANPYISGCQGLGERREREFDSGDDDSVRDEENVLELARG